MNIITTSIEGILIIEPQTFEDQRGFFMETYNQSRYVKAGVNKVFVQDNLINTGLDIPALVVCQGLS